MPLLGSEPTIPENSRPQAHALDRAATGIGHHVLLGRLNQRRMRWSGYVACIAGEVEAEGALWKREGKH
jgi:hypothetical protein